MQSLIDRPPDDIDILARYRLEQANRHDLSLATAGSCTGGLPSAAPIDRNELEGKNAHSPAIDDAETLIDGAVRRKDRDCAAQKRWAI